MGKIQLHGFWYSPYTFRVVWALKLKGIPYENIEEDRFNKSPLLLQYNPIYKKTPVLVQDGKPICESMIILEYIDEIYQHYPLTPADPYERAQTRFWVKFIDDTMLATAALFRSCGDENLEKAIEETREWLRVVEDECLTDEKKFLGGDTVNIVDIALGSFVKFVEILEDILRMKVLEAQKFPRLHLWFNNFKDVQIIKENTPDQDKLVASLKTLR